MRKLIEQFISVVKHEEYHLDPQITTGTMIGVLLERAVMAARGVFRPVRNSGLLFIGSHVRIKCPGKMWVGQSSTINDNCYINATSKEGIRIGASFSLGRNSIIDCTGILSELGESLVIGNNVGISPNFTLFVRGKVVIGDDTIIGPNVTIVAENHIADRIDIPIHEQGCKRMGIRIGEKCWIGANVVILDGVSIGEGSIVAAGAVVNRDVEAYSVVGGIPAKVISQRKNKETNENNTCTL